MRFCGYLECRLKAIYTDVLISPHLIKHKPQIEYSGCFNIARSTYVQDFF